MERNRRNSINTIMPEASTTIVVAVPTEKPVKPRAPRMVIAEIPPYRGPRTLPPPKGKVTFEAWDTQKEQIRQIISEVGSPSLLEVVTTIVLDYTKPPKPEPVLKFNFCSNYSGCMYHNERRFPASDGYGVHWHCPRKSAPVNDGCTDAYKVQRELRKHWNETHKGETDVSDYCKHQYTREESDSMGCVTGSGARQTRIYCTDCGELVHTKMEYFD